jgi:hypothetical protein
MKRTEPSAYLAPTKDQPKLSYVPAAATDIAARFRRMRDEKLAQEPGIVQLRKKVKP